MVERVAIASAQSSGEEADEIAKLRATELSATELSAIERRASWGRQGGGGPGRTRTCDNTVMSGAF